MKVRDRRQIQKLMVIQEISLRQLAQQAGFQSWSYLGRILRGEVDTLSTDKAVGISKVLGVGVDDLFLAQMSTGTPHNVKPKKAKVAA